MPCCCLASQPNAKANRQTPLLKGAWGISRPGVCAKPSWQGSQTHGEVLDTSWSGSTWTGMRCFARLCALVAAKAQLPLSNPAVWFDANLVWTNWLVNEMLALISRFRVIHDACRGIKRIIIYWTPLGKCLQLVLADHISLDSESVLPQCQISRCYCYRTTLEKWMRWTITGGVVNCMVWLIRFRYRHLIAITITI